MQKRLAPSSADADTTAEVPVLLTGDGAQTSVEHDEFGLEEISKSIASTLISRLSSSGYAIGLEGTWGSGKTSLSNVVAEEIGKTAGPYHKLIRFQPWLVGTKRSLLKEFFQLLIVKIREVGDTPSVRSKLHATKPDLVATIVQKIERYRLYLDVIATITKGAAAFDPSGYTRFGAFVLWGLSKLAALVKKKPVILESMKSDIEDDLRALLKFLPDMRFTVVIDDMDRLDPDESVEILRLIKAVADFPAVAYLVCFDMQVLAEQVTRTIGVANGRNYIEKIFQVLVTVPPQEAFALRRFVRKLLATAFPDEMQLGGPASLDQRERAEVLFDVWAGKLIKTPRDAVRFCEAVKLGWPYLRGRADFIDYAWLQLVRIKCPDLYSWTRNYVVGLGSYRDRFAALERWIAENLAEDLRVERLAEKAGMSARHFARRYAEARKMTPARAVEAIRVDAAKRALEESDDRMPQIAKRCGFSDEDQMRVAFARQVGISPVAYRTRFAA